MRFSALAMLVLVVGLCACAKNGGQSASTATTAPDASVSTDANGATATSEPTAADTITDAEVYPGATLKANVPSSAGAMGGTLSAKSYVTSDSYAKVTAWYKAHMPADAHESHALISGRNRTRYVLSLGSRHQEKVSIVSSPATGKTVIIVIDVHR